MEAIEAVPYTSPIHSDYYGLFSCSLLLTGLIFMSLFFLHTVRKKKSIIIELLLATISSILLGFGSLFLFLYAGIYV